MQPFTRGIQLASNRLVGCWWCGEVFQLLYRREERLSPVICNMIGKGGLIRDEQTDVEQGGLILMHPHVLDALLPQCFRCSSVLPWVRNRALFEWFRLVAPIVVRWSPATVVYHLVPTAPFVCRDKLMNFLECGARFVHVCTVIIAPVGGLDRCGAVVVRCPPRRHGTLLT